MRSIKRLAGVGVLVSAVVVGMALGAPTGQGGKVRVFMLQGGGHDWKHHLPMLAEILENTGDFTVTLSKDLNQLKAENIRKYDLVFFYGSGLNFSDPSQEKGLCEFVRAGGGYAGVHSASDSFKKSDRYWEMVGGRFAGHGHGTYTVHICDKDHPITAPLEDFEITDECYRHSYHKNLRMRALTCMDWGNERQTMAWVRDYGKGRMFYTANGHGRKAWTNPHWQRLVVRGMYWAAGRDVKDPPAAK